jgi:hypothetical protein
MSSMAVRLCVNGLIAIILWQKNMFLVAQSIHFAETPAGVCSDHLAVTEKYKGQKLRYFAIKTDPVSRVLGVHLSSSIFFFRRSNKM